MLASIVVTTLISWYIFPSLLFQWHFSRKNCQWGWVPFWFSILWINILLELETDSSHPCI